MIIIVLEEPAAFIFRVEVKNVGNLLADYMASHS
jgi:hypothetical protein